MRPYTLQSGISDSQIQQLLHYTETDPEIQATTADWRTPEGKPGRFSSLSAFNTWRDQGKTTYTLVDDQQNLAGLTWFSNKSIDQAKYKEVAVDLLKQYQTTLGIRLYASARGQKLAKPFLTEAIDTYLELLGQKQLSLWLEVRTDNARAIHLYENIGFQQVTENRDHSQVLLLAQVSGKL